MQFLGGDMERPIIVKPLYNARLKSARHFAPLRTRIKPRRLRAHAALKAPANAHSCAVRTT
jgi:hypothetical protein